MFCPIKLRYTNILEKSLDSTSTYYLQRLRIIGEYFNMSSHVLVLLTSSQSLWSNGVVISYLFTGDLTPNENIFLTNKTNVLHTLQNHKVNMLHRFIFSPKQQLYQWILSTLWCKFTVDLIVTSSTRWQHPRWQIKVTMTLQCLPELKKEAEEMWQCDQ